MLFKIFAKSELPRFYETIGKNHLAGPVSRGHAADGRELFDFDYVDDFELIRPDYVQTLHSPKRFFLPYRENLSTFHIKGRDWDKQVDYNVYKPLVLFGLHACDINALNKLDKVLSQSLYPDPFYTAKRKNLFIIGMNCLNPTPSCFCRSMGSDTVLHGFEMYLTDLGDRYFAEIRTSWAFDVVQHLDSRDASEEDHYHYMEIVREKNRKFTTEVNTTDLTKILDMEFHSEAWKKWGDKCLSCGTCANVCPTCYCYGVEENVDLDLRHANKTRQLYSCNLIDFAVVAGGHNFRPERHVRLKYRYYHKHRGFVEAFEESLCVGCGRCGDSCLADITVPEVIESIRSTEKIDE